MALSKKDRTQLIAALNVGLLIYVPDRDNRKHFAQLIGEKLEVPLLTHFVETCVADYIQARS